MNRLMIEVLKKCVHFLDTLSDVKKKGNKVKSLKPVGHDYEGYCSKRRFIPGLLSNA